MTNFNVGTLEVAFRLNVKEVTVNKWLKGTSIPNGYNQAKILALINEKRL